MSYVNITWRQKVQYKLFRDRTSYSGKKMCNEFPRKQWSLNSVKKLIKTINKLLQQFTATYNSSQSQFFHNHCLPLGYTNTNKSRSKCCSNGQINQLCQLTEHVQYWFYAAFQQYQHSNSPARLAPLTLLIKTVSCSTLFSIYSVWNNVSQNLKYQINVFEQQSNN